MRSLRSLSGTELVARLGTRRETPALLRELDRRRLAAQKREAARQKKK